MPYDYLKKDYNQYENFKLQKNPFAIAPLFRSFKDIKKCKEEENVFVLPKELENEIKTLIKMEERRALIYGLYGVGKTSLVDFIMYIAYNFHKRMCIRVVITEDNVERAINEMLLTVCFEILSEISNKSVLKPVTALRKWLIQYQRADFIMENILKLVGKYCEINENTNKTQKKGTIKASLGIGGEYGFEEEIQVRKSIQSYVEVLSMRKVAEYLEDFIKIAQQLGFKDIIIYIDEADHLKHIDKFLSMLTRAREILFSTGYTFFVAGSLEVAKHSESMGSIFDKLIFVQPADYITFCKILDQRIQFINPKLSLSNIFEEKALEIIFEKTKGTRKSFLRLAENALDFAANENHSKVSESHCLKVLSKNEDTISSPLKENQIKILKYSAQNGSLCASNKSLQQLVSLKRVQLRKILEELFEMGYVKRQQKGRSVYYQISTPYKPYFLNEN